MKSTSYRKPLSVKYLDIKNIIAKKDKLANIDEDEEIYAEERKFHEKNLLFDQLYGTEFDEGMDRE